MKRLAPWLLGAAGIAAILLLLPFFNAAQPRDVRITSSEAERLATAEARRLGIPVDRAWSSVTWVGSPLLDKELERDPARRRKAALDPVIGPRLGGYHVAYYRRGEEKFYPYGYVYVAGDGAILAARRQMRPEQGAASATEAQLRPEVDAFVHSRVFPGAPNPEFEEARPNVLRSRTDWLFRYRVRSSFPTGNVVPYLFVYYNGATLGGWALIEEYADGAPFKGETGQIGGEFLRFGTLFTILLVLAALFLKKYHAGEAGVTTSGWLFFAILLLSVALDLVCASGLAENTNFGSLDAQRTSWVIIAFKLLFYDLPSAVAVFFGWAIGESYARERWSEKLASFDAILHRDAVNATVGRSVLRGALMGPAVAASALIAGAIPVLLGVAQPSLGSGSRAILLFGGPIVTLLSGALDAIYFPIVAILFVLAFSSRKRLLPLGIVIAVVFGTVSSLCEPPIDPYVPRLLFSFGAIAACAATFLAYDLLTTSVALFFGSILSGSLLLLTGARGDLLAQLLTVLGVPLMLAVAFAAAGLMTRREVAYANDDLAPHVKRIVERERVKAEIDAANRIQAALLPQNAPHLTGASVASHYRAATEIGGDYFDFLPQPTGEIGIAFGDVSGHGLTSGIVMAMAKSALLVQVGYDASPRVVMNVLNDVVMKTAPRRILMTFFFGVLDPRTRTLRFSSAGHLDPYVYRGATGRLEPLSSWGFPLGVRRRDPFGEHAVAFDEGDRLILYSDGLIEAVDDDGEPFGFERFEHAIAAYGDSSAEAIKKAILTSVRKFTRNRPPEDDQTLVVVSFDHFAPALASAPAFAAAEA